MCFCSPKCNTISRGLVTDSKERTLELRCLVSASNSSRAFDLLCEVREHLVAFIQQHYPGSLPKTRTLTESPDQPFTLAPAGLE